MLELFFRIAINHVGWYLSVYPEGGAKDHAVIPTEG